MMRNDAAETLTQEMQNHMNEWLKRYPADQKRSGVFEALRIVQEYQGGWLTVPWMNAVADFLEIPRTAVYEVATFYSMFRLQPVGKYVLELCTNISCTLRGAEDTLAELKKKLGIEVGETTADDLFTLKEVECLGACVNAPVCQVGKQYVEDLTADKVEPFLAAFPNLKW